jgi:hypothetical protein
MSTHQLIEQSMPADYQDFYVENILQKGSATFRPVLDKSANNSAADFSGHSDFYGATFVFCGRNICQLATLT